MKWSFKFATVRGIELKIHATFFLIILLGAMQWKSFGPTGLIFGAVLMAVLFACVTLHELGHSLVAQHFGIRVREIVLLPIGGVAMLERNPDKPLQELLIAVAGPAVNVVIALLLGLYLGFYSLTSGINPQTLLHVASSGPSLNALLIWVFNANIMLVMFNMIPAFPMDGGRVFRALLGFAVDWSTATKVSSILGQILSIGLGLLGLFTGNIFLPLIAVMIFFAAGASREDEQARAVLSTRRIGDIYNKYAITLSETDTVSRVVDFLLKSYQPDFAVTRDGQLLGVVSREHVLRSMRRSLADEPVTNILVRDVVTVDASASIEEVREQMVARQTRLAAVYEYGKYLGLVSEDDIAEALVIIAFEHRRQPAPALPLPEGCARPA